MKKLFGGLIAVCMMLTMTACFDMTEEITITKDGSGVYTTIMDASKMMEQMKMFAAMDTTGEMMPKMKAGIDSALYENWNKYKTVKGISNLKIDTSKEFVYRLTFDFKDVAALNGALNLDKKDAKDKDAYAWSKGKITRKDIALNLADLGMGDDEQMEMAKGMLTDVSYTLIFKVPKEVKSTSNKEAKIAADKKSVTQKVSLLDLIDKKAKLGNEVSYK